MQLPKYTFGVGDRFGRQGKAQLQALLKAKEVLGVEIAPVWNKSYREHNIIGTNPADVRAEADAAVAALGYDGPYFVDADHIGLKNVDLFVESSDFFTLDVADFTGKAAADDDIAAFVAKHSDLAGTVMIDGIDTPVMITTTQIEDAAKKYLFAVQEASKIYRHVAEIKGADNFVTEVSMDETDRPQTPIEMLFILAAIADAGIPAQTIAPKFTGRFNKSVDYVGDVERFSREFEEDLALIRFAVERFGLPTNLKLSVHSGSDKFSIYKPIGDAIRKFDAGLHLKTAGTTWLEEIIGLAAGGREGLAIAKEVYASAFPRAEALCEPYATVIDIDESKLPTVDEVNAWTGEQYANALRHDPTCPAFNPHLRQLLHVGYKVAAELGNRYLDALDQCEDIVAANVTENLLERHIKRVFK